MLFVRVQKLDQPKMTNFTLSLNQHNSPQHFHQTNPNQNQHKTFCNLEVENALDQYRNQQETW